MMMMTWSNREEFTPCPGNEESPFPPAARALIQFFDTQVQAGRIRKTNPRVLAATYFGGLMNYALVEIIRRGHPVPADEFVPGFVDVLWEGVAPKGKS